MFKISSLLIAIAILVVATSGVVASPVNKCTVNGAVIYQQGPCLTTQVNKQATNEALNSEQKKPVAKVAASAEKLAPAAVNSGFRCDGRQYCSQMTSCAEAKYFLANCPNPKMDGDNDGIPCETQLCNQ